VAEAERDFEAALTAYAAHVPEDPRRVPLPFPAARLELAHGSLLRRTGGRRVAIEHLRKAHAGLAALGAAPFLAECEAELAACGLQAPAADTFGVMLYELGDCFIILNTAAGVPPYITLAQAQEWVSMGTITMTKKGGAFDPGSIAAKGVKDQGKFEKAIGRFSKKRVEFA
jgi:hypothetical protein